MKKRKSMEFDNCKDINDEEKEDPVTCSLELMGENIIIQ